MLKVWCRLAIQIQKPSRRATYRDEGSSDPRFVVECIRDPDSGACLEGGGVGDVRELGARMVAPDDGV